MTLPVPGAGKAERSDLMKAHPAAWPAVPQDLSAHPDEVHVWRWAVRLPSSVHAVCRSLLDHQERAAADRFVFAADSRRFTTSRAFLRLILSRYLHADPRSLSFVKGEHGKPRLAVDPGAAPCHFNVSHSGSFGLAAVAWQREVGVDIEWTGRAVRHLEVARRVFTRAELRQLEELPEAERALAFFTGWTRKEAVVKALGTGISQPLDSFAVSLLPGEPSALDAGTGPGAVAGLTLVDLEPGPGHVGALAVRGSGWTLRQFAAEGLVT